MNEPIASFMVNGYEKTLDYFKIVPKDSTSTIQVVEYSHQNTKVNIDQQKTRIYFASFVMMILIFYTGAQLIEGLLETINIGGIIPFISFMALFVILSLAYDLQNRLIRKFGITLFPFETEYLSIRGSNEEVHQCLEVLKYLSKIKDSENYALLLNFMRNDNKNYLEKVDKNARDYMSDNKIVVSSGVTKNH